MTFAHHSQVINYLIQRLGFGHYLEIGVHRPQGNFDLIRCKYKMGVDPNGRAMFTGTSDQYFAENKQKFDITFLDGDHEYIQCKRDLANSLACLNENGIILIHDTYPQDELFACSPRNGLRGRWNGDIYKLLFDLHQMNVDFRTIDFDGNGLTIVRVGNDDLYKKSWPGNDYQLFNEHRAEVANLVTQQQFEQWI